MKTVLMLDNVQRTPLPPQFARDDVRYPPALVRRFLEEYTQEGDVVFDPFAGFGTTLLVAEKLGRIGLGLEYVPKRAAYIAGLLSHEDHIICGDARRLAEYPLPVLDFSITSPPFMTKNDHDEYPFAAYSVTGQGYEDYLQDIQSIYRQLAEKLRPGGYAVIEASNIQKSGTLTTLACDIAKSVDAVLPLQKEFVVSWTKDGAKEGYGFGYDHSYCLVFQKPL